ncbi:etoposide-induced protein 2.4 (EI24) [Pseudoduganella lurida]|uniref:Etoposide-induced protein 2.4 (EI24) n=1 Tax=Pseudoduganella lurida TaxID=1036180 RepID=A0A562R8W5_9BURK|nr:EI24 domain-containing protein [Pseudoduganella lurida]TWI65518.1 etoposide-induced protein 2.4 (EI24) [Pseudoduganella lurida]
MRGVMNAYGRAMLSQLHGKILLLSAIPFVLSLVVWGLVLWFAAQPLLDWLQGWFFELELFNYTTPWLEKIGLTVLKSVLPPLLAMLLLLPLMILTSLIFINLAAMPVIVNHVGSRHYPHLVKKQGGSMFKGLVKALSLFLLFIVIWFCMLPLYIVPPLAIVASALLWGWLTSRVMSYDALSDHASAEEIALLQHEKRWQLLAIGVMSGAAGSLPSIVWIGGAVLAVALFPFLVAASVWLYVLIFIFTGLWFEYYCLEALSQLRARTEAAAVNPITTVESTQP